MNAGRELDALVAEKVMGWAGVEFMRDLNANTFFTKADTIIIPDYSNCIKSFSPSTSISDAWQVVEKLAKDGDEHPVCMQKGLPASGDHATPFEVLKNYAGYPGWTCYFHDYEVCAHADTAPLAICLAALKAVGVEVPND